MAVVNGKIVQLDNEVVGIPIIQETLVPYGQSITINTVTWFVCVNDKGEIEFIASTDFDPTQSSSTYDLASVDHTRLFYALNPNNISPMPYQITGTYLSDLVLNYSKLTPIAIITSTVGLVSGTWIITSSTTHDARRFVYNGFGGLSAPFVWGNNASFRTFDSINSWLEQLLNFKSALTYNNMVGQKVIVKGPITLTSAISPSYNSEVIFEGDGGSFTISTISSGINLGSNITFRNLQFINAYDPIANSDPNYISGLLSNNANAIVYCNVNTTNGNKNIKIDNCSFSSALQNRYPFIVFNFGGSNAFAENISITNSKFNTTFAADDKLSVISFIGPSVASTSTIGPRLINCNVSNNTCNKNQLILLSSPLVSDGYIHDLIVGVNVQINNNICGAINALTKYDTLNSVFNTTFSKDKNNGVIIYGNNCKFIYCGMGNGSMVDGYGNRVCNLLAGNTEPPLIVNGIFTGALTIENNITSFIHVGQRISTTYSPTAPNIIIQNNRLFATDSSAATGYLNSYYGSFIAPSYSFTSIAMLIDKTVGS